jgi:hypothetical protein
MEQCPNGQEVTNPRRFGLALLGGTLENLLDSDSLSLPNFSTQDYMPLSEIAEVAVPMPRSQELLANNPKSAHTTSMHGYEWSISV